MLNIYFIVFLVWLFIGVLGSLIAPFFLTKEENTPNNYFGNCTGAFAIYWMYSFCVVWCIGTYVLIFHYPIVLLVLLAFAVVMGSIGRAFNL